MNVAQMSRRFAVPGQIVSARPFGSGNVNDTYLVISRTTYSEVRFILQRIRKAVFAEPVNIMRNMRIICDHCHAKMEAEQATADRVWQLPKIIETEDGADFAIDAQGDLWRAISHIASATAFETVQNLEHAQEAGEVLGHFQRLICDIPTEKLVYTLPGFHVAPRYLEQLEKAATTPLGQTRLAASPEAQDCLAFVLARREKCFVLENAREKGVLPKRPVHGDPKVGNIMIDEETKRGTCIVDLDTVQPGLIHYDIGDCMRSCCNPAGEDAMDLDAVRFDARLCAAIYRGYHHETRSFVTEAEREYFYEAVHLLPLELGIRFLADYLAGDVYFKVRRPAHNLHRALVQFKLTESVEAQEKEVRRILEAD